jgi:exodeoxyribonuclease V alpha subunit
MLDAMVGDGGARDAVERQIARLLESPRASSIIGRVVEARTPLLLLDRWLQMQRIFAAETRLARDLARMLRAGAPGFADARDVSAALADVADRPAVIGGQQLQLTDSQLQAITCAIRSRLTAVSGGPGSGKTSIVVAILRVLVRMGFEPEQIALAAPTGKAAYRMREMIERALASLANPAAADASLDAAKVEPATIHRLLGYSPSRGSFRHHRNNPLSYRVVIVDEASMLDLVLMERLVGALNLDAQLILLGDADQLPSVAAGAVFRDLVPADGARSHPMAAHSTRLQGSHRTGSAGGSGEKLRAVGDAIKRGDTALIDAYDASGQPLIASRANVEQVRFDAVEYLEGGADPLSKVLDRWHIEGGIERAIDLAATPFEASGGRIEPRDRARMRELFGLLSAARILTVLRAGATGAEGVNAAMHARICSRVRVAPWRARMIPGEPVIVLRNDYERQLFNGDQGVIASLALNGERCAVFERAGEFMCYRLAALQDRLALAFAITVHKAQGSEFERVAIVLPERPQPALALPILTRELLYTAVTRARRSALIVGARALIAETVQNPVTRDSGLEQALESAIAAAVE